MWNCLWQFYSRTEKYAYMEIILNTWQWQFVLSNKLFNKVASQTSLLKYDLSKTNENQCKIWILVLLSSKSFYFAINIYNDIIILTFFLYFFSSSHKNSDLVHKILEVI